MEKESILKEEFQLTWKSLFPNSIERQNVKLALKVLDMTTVAALEFLNHKLMHWTIGNVQLPLSILLSKL